jgi:transcriptional regulator with XRE-family HTH domain
MREGLTPLGQRLYIARAHKQFSYADLAHRSGYSANHLSDLGRDPNANPKLLLLTDLAEALGVRPAWLAFNDGEMLP